MPPRPKPEGTQMQARIPIDPSCTFVLVQDVLRGPNKPTYCDWQASTGENDIFKSD